MAIENTCDLCQKPAGEHAVQISAMGGWFFNPPRYICEKCDHTIRDEIDDSGLLDECEAENGELTEKGEREWGEIYMEGLCGCDNTIHERKPTCELHLIAAIARETANTIRWEYSGRSMFGRKCFGFIASSERMQWAVKTLRTRHVDYRTDNMAFDYIIYFPSVTGDAIRSIAPNIEHELDNEMEN